MFAKIAANHPSLKGHFPGNPIAPGSLILEEVILALNQTDSSLKVNGFPTVTFSKWLRPECSFRIEFERKSKEHIHFTCRADEQVLCVGVVTFSAAQDRL